MRKLSAVVWAVLYVATIFAANWAVQKFGIITVAGLAAPAGVLFAGLAFTLRDLTQDAGGKLFVLGAIAVGAAASAFVSPALAAASAIAFGVSELADFAVYTPLRTRDRMVLAVALSNTVGAIVDSFLFLTISGFGLGHGLFAGQIIGKLLMTALAVGVLGIVRGRRHAYDPDNTSCDACMDYALEHGEA